MRSTPTDRPWGLNRATALAEPTAADPPAAMAIDPDTQLTTYYDAGGQIVHAGPPKHGTSRQTVTSQPTSGGDGQHRNSPDDARVVTYVPD